MRIVAVEKEYSHQELERKILEYWDSIDLVNKIREERRSGPKFYFLDGPPYMNNPPHLGHARTRAIRDPILKYRVMRGYNVRLQPGFDMHGLPIEVRVEEMINSRSKRDIEKFGVEKFIETCKKRAYEYRDRWTTFYRRFGLHMDLENPYLTLDNDYIESSWLFFKKAEEKGLLYRGKGTVAWCPRCETPLSGYEATDEYLDVTDPSIYLKFPLENPGGEFLLVWTTTPWTLPGNVAIAINPRFDYAKIKAGEETWIVAEQALERLEGKLPQLEREKKVLEVVPGSKLLGLRYIHPLSPKIPAHKKLAGENPRLHMVVAADFVSAEEGTGCVHIAPGHGPEDYTLGLKENLPIFSPVDEKGVFTDEAGDYKGLYVKNADPLIIKDLEECSSLVHQEKIKHRYPHCWRCKSPLIYRASDQWFISIDPIKEQMLEANNGITWVPPWAGSKRFHDWIVNARDWCISRQRYWGIPLPIWICTNKKCSHRVVVSSLEEIKAMAKELPQGGVDLHKPWLDKVVLVCPKCGGEMRRIPDIADVWFDSGASSWASLGYPKRKEEFEKWFPVDFITEGLDQTRGWFYTLLVEGIVAFDQTPYRTVLMNEFVLDERGEKMSKSLGNVIDPLEVIDQLGADTTRFYLVSEAAAWDKIKVNRKSLQNAGRMINILWNVYKFATIYMSLDRYAPQQPGGEGLRLEDRWILSRVNTLVGDVTESFEKLYLHQAARALREFIVEDLSHLYVRLVRSRVWLEEDHPEKLAAYHTLYYVLTRLSRLLAPITPFIAEEIYQNLEGGKKSSVHVASWPSVEERWVDKGLEEDMVITKRLVEAVASARQKGGLKLRWPVKRVTVLPMDERVSRAVERTKRIFCQLANTKEVVLLSHSDELPGVQIRVEPVMAALGPMYREEAGEIKKLVQGLEGREALRKIGEDGFLELVLSSGRRVRLLEEHLRFTRVLPRGVVAGECVYGIVYVDTTHTEELEAERLARELIRRIQAMRKMMGLAVDDMVRVSVECGAEEEALLGQQLGFIAGEVRASKLGFEKVRKSQGLVKEWQIDGKTFVIGVVRDEEHDKN